MALAANEKPQDYARHGNRIDALDGLRTIAVFLVIGFHVSMPYMAAGYIGVDMFFVLSGYLITAGLVHEIRTRGRLRLARFWSRRFKRLMPAALLAILVVFVWGMWFAPLYRRSDLGADAWWTVFYLANWRFVNAGSYFESDGTLSPLEHMWSLAVEEQFYLVWPLLITVVLWVAYRLAHSRMPQLAGEGESLREVNEAQRQLRGRMLIAIIVAAGLIIMASSLFLYLDNSFISQNRAYMGTDAKAFEPMLGALLAILASYPKISAWFGKCSHALIWAGAGLMFALFIVIDGPAPFYFSGGALAYSLGMGAVIVGVAHGLHGFEARVLAWGPISYLGRISYGLYLWHWPLAVWLLQPQLGFQPKRAALVVVLTIVTAVLSYHFLEMPIRSGKLNRIFSPKRAIISAFVAMLIVAGIVSTLGGTPLSRAAEPFVRNVLYQGKKPPVNESTILVVGDSVPKRLVPALVPVAQKRGWDVVSAARGACTPMALRLDFGPADPTGVNCPTALDVQREMMSEHNPGIVLWWSRYEIIDRYDSDGVTLLHPDSDAFWLAQERDFKIAADRFTQDGATLVVVLTERPGAGMLNRPQQEIDLPLIQNMLYHDEYRQRFNEIVTKVAAQRSDIRVISGDELFCAGKPTLEGSSVCDDSVPGKGYIRPDGAHVNLEYFGESVSNKLLDALEKG
ncbi:MAG: acyltransferase family protein [Varibaculum sp.]|nr:acyltransferase family protein [Varibaculum sp.]